MTAHRDQGPPNPSNAANLSGAARRRNKAKNGEWRDSTARPYIIEYRKRSGDFREYGRYADRGEADNVVRLLRWAGAIANVRVDGLAA